MMCRNPRKKCNVKDIPVPCHWDTAWKAPANKTRNLRTAPSFSKPITNEGAGTFCSIFLWKASTGVWKECEKTMTPCRQQSGELLLTT